ncbi:MAG TPA: protein kinase [Myxococcales bacterium]
MELGRYRLEEQVGQGGMAVVWRGWDSQLRRTVAVKILHAHLHAREDIRKRFDREAHAVARLHHPHIIDVYDFSDDPSYLVTEFIRGTTLRQFADAHPFDPPELAAACLLPIAEALAHAHAAGVVHRDVKPENVMVREDGVVKLTDFGIAALLEPDEKFTVTGSILGSPAHLAPETIEGKPADPRSDLFSFGTILYWLSCGQLPFQATSPAALLRNILDGKRLDPRLVRPSVSDAQARIIGRCLETNPAQRYQSAAEVQQDLLAMLRESGIEEPLKTLAAFVRDPEREAARVRALLVERALAQGEEQLVQGKTSAALSSFGRALGLDPNNEIARGKVSGIRRHERTRRFFMRGTAVLAVILFAGAGFQLWAHKGAVVAAATVATTPQQAGTTKTAPKPTETPSQEPAATGTAKSGETASATKTGTTNPGAPSRDTTDSERTSRPAAKPERNRKPAEPRREPEKPRAVAQATPLTVKLHVRFVAHVTVDGEDRGDDNMFTLRLLPGPHQVIVRHPCCVDAPQEVVVTPNRKDQIYQLHYGAPLPAQFRVTNAPPDARVLVDGVLVGTASDPRPYSMTQPDQRAVVTIGDRKMTTTLKAGTFNLLDYAQATP